MKISRFFLLALLVLPSTALGWSYPIKQVAKVECKFSDRSTLGDDCKIPLPIIQNGNYKNYKDNKLYRLVYSVLWTSTYTNGWDVGNGSHLGVDIATARGTPVYAIGDGEVVVAGVLNGWGNAVVIKHKLGDKIVYSVYAHLDKITTTKGSQTKEGDKIGEVGHTGNSSGNHLHFQIDINQTGFHPYYHNSCKSGGSIDQIVNQGLCQEYVTQNTIDPIYFIETNGVKIEEAKDQTQIDKISEQVKQDQEIKPTEIISRQELLKTELDIFLSKYNLKLESKIPGNVLKPGETGSLNISMTDKLGRKFDDILPEEIEISYDKDILSVAPDSIKFIDNGTREISINAKKIGKTQIILKMMDQIIGTYTIRVDDGNTQLEAQNAFVQVPGTHYVGNEYRGIAVLKDSDSSNIINVPYRGDFVLKAGNNVKICGFLINELSQLSSLSSKKCITSQLTNQMSFDYSKSLKGILVFKVLPIKEGPLELSIYQGTKKLGTNMYDNISLANLGATNDDYYNYVKKAFSKLIVRNEFNGNFGGDYTIKESDAVNWINNAWSDSPKSTGKSYKYLTRIEFMRLLSNLTGIKGQNKKIFIDVSSTDYVYANILPDHDFHFLDNFSKKYFQPDQKITRKEAAYIIAKLKGL